MTDEQINYKLNLLKNDRQTILDYKVKGSIIRSRQNWLECGEKNTKYFFNLEKKNYKNKNRYCLRDEKGNITYDIKSIIKIQDSYYEELYRSESTSISKKYLNNTRIKKLDTYESELMSRPIDKNEIKEAIWSMKNDKAPGSEGLPVEFYKFFWEDIKGLVYHTIQEAIGKGEFSNSSRRGIITLIEKEGKDILDIKNWRPLSLLNMDIKIFSKILAKRLENTLPQLIHSDQTGFMKGRSINENLFDLISSINYCHRKKIEALLISYDVAKAFDRTERNVLYDVMRAFGIHEGFIKYIKVLYQNVESCTINCGFTGRYFNIERSLRQGCALSAPAFLLLVEILGQNIRDNIKIKGIKIGEKEKKHAQYADDLWALILANEQNVQSLTKEIKKFTKNTGLKINYDKTQVLRIGPKSKSKAQYYSLKPEMWTDKVKILGIIITNDIQDMVKINYDIVLEKMYNVLNKWKARSLSLIGKIQVVNTLIMSIITQKLTVLPDPPENVCCEIKKNYH